LILPNQIVTRQKYSATMLTKFLLVVATSTVADGFAFDIFSAFKADPVLSRVAQSEMGNKFTIQMDIGKKGDETHMSLNGLDIELLHGNAPKDEQVGLPGANGPHPKTSTGALALKVHSAPSFIDIFGTQRVRFEKPCYELIWKKDNHCGLLICGFNLPMGAKRNGADLPAGRLYLSFPVWSQWGLAIRQAERNEAEERAQEFSEERDAEILKYTESTNLIQKAFHYRNAAAAVQKIEFTGIRSLMKIPSDSEVTPIGNGLLLTTKGTVWNKQHGFLGDKHIPLGEAILAPLVDEAAQDVLRP